MARYSWRFISQWSVQRRVELWVLDEGTAQLAGRFDPIGVGGQEDAPGADAVGLGIVYPGRGDVVLHVRLDRLDEAPANADDHRIRGAQVLGRAIEDRTHAAGHGRVLHGDAGDARVPRRADIFALCRPVDLEVIGQLLLGSEAAVPVGG